VTPSGDTRLVVGLGSGEVLDLNQVPPRLRQDVWDVVQARQRWAQVVDTLAPGPLRARLAALGERIDVGIAEAYATARRVGEVERVVTALDPDRATSEFKAAKRRAVAGAPPPGFEAIESRFLSVQRLLNLIDDAEAQLGLADTRLTAAVARAAELAFTADVEALDGVGGEVDRVIEELDALRHAFDGLR
jgi:hypothetical protein